MVQQMKFNPMFQPAIMQVFGKTLICRDIDKASYFAKNTNHDCITLDGTHVAYSVCTAVEVKRFPLQMFQCDVSDSDYNPFGEKIMFGT